MINPKPLIVSLNEAGLDRRYSVYSQSGSVIHTGPDFDTLAEARDYINHQTPDRRWFIVDEHTWTPTEVFIGEQLSLF